jgi:outer membrane protein assembly factor BamE (lipoprotein component of BamABCDE complex)
VRRLLLLPLLVPVAVSAAQVETFDKTKFLTLKPGMTKDEVVAIVGQPLQKWSADRVFVYRYFGPDLEPGKPLLIVVTAIFDNSEKLSSVDYYSNQPKVDQPSPTP